MNETIQTATAAATATHNIQTLLNKTLNKVATNTTTTTINSITATPVGITSLNLSDYTSQHHSLTSSATALAAAIGFDAAGGNTAYDAASDNVTMATIATTTGSSIRSIVADVGAAVTTTPLPTPLTTHQYIAATATSTLRAQTVATFVAGNKNRATTIIVYPTVSPESIVIPIVSCIFGFPILALIVICCLRRRAKLARERDRRRNYDMQDHAVSLVRFSPIHRLNCRSSRAISLRPERSLSQGFTSIELDTVVEERGSDVEQTQTELLNAESPMESTSYKMSISS